MSQGDRERRRTILLPILILVTGLVLLSCMSQRTRPAAEERVAVGASPALEQPIGLAATASSIARASESPPAARRVPEVVARPRGTIWLDLPEELRVGEPYAVPVYAEAGDLWFYSYIVAFEWDPEVLEFRDVEGAPEFRIAYHGEDLAGGVGQFGYLRLSAGDEAPAPLGRVHIANIMLTARAVPAGGRTAIVASDHAESWFIACPDHDCSNVTDEDARLLDPANRHTARLADHELTVLPALD